MEASKKTVVRPRFLQGDPESPDHELNPMAGALIGVSVAGGEKVNMVVPGSGSLDPITIQPGQKAKFTFEGMSSDAETSYISPTLMHKYVGRTIGEAGEGSWSFIWPGMQWWAPTRPHLPAHGHEHQKRHVFKYLVKHGDTLSGLAQHFKTTVQQIRSDNGLTSSRIYAGKSLYIYGKKPQHAHHSTAAHSGQSGAIEPVVDGSKHNIIHARSGEGANHPIAAITPINNNKLSNDVINAARSAQNKWHVPASVTLAQFIIESHWGRQMPHNSNNPFGIKAVSGQPYVMAWTHETINHVSVRVKAPFRVFPSLDEAFEAHGKLLATSKHYARSRQYAGDPDAYADSLTHVYATDDNYGATLKRTMKKYDLYMYNVN